MAISKPANGSADHVATSSGGAAAAQATPGNNNIPSIAATPARMSSPYPYFAYHDSRTFRTLIPSKPMQAGCHAFEPPTHLLESVRNTSKACGTRDGLHAFAMFSAASLHSVRSGESMAHNATACFLTFHSELTYVSP